MREKENRIRLTLGLTIVTLSLILVLVVGYGQALKSYRQLTTDTIIAQMETAQLGIEQTLHSGVPLESIAGLNKVLQPIVDSDASVVGVRLLRGQKLLYLFGNVTDYDSSLSVMLNNKFTQVGVLDIFLSDKLVKKNVFDSFKKFILLIVFLLIAFTASVLKSTQRTVYLSSFTAVFIVMSVSVILLVGSLYRDGLQSKAESLADVVSQRLSPILFHDVAPDLVVGVESMLNNFRQSHPKLSYIAVYKDKRKVASSQEGNVTSQALFESGALEYIIATSETSEVRLSYKADVVLAKLFQILKNFSMLFFACGLVCFVFIRLLNGEGNQQKENQVLERIKPLFLGAVLMESLMAPIMPQYMTAVAESAGLGSTASSIFFSLYFLGFALALLPAAKLVELYSMQRVLVGGFVLSSLGCALLVTDLGLWAILAARLSSGIGQAMVFIAVQAYIFKFSNKENKTQAAGIIVFCFNAGFIVGVAIGALLADYWGDHPTFILAACIGVIMSLFSFVLPVAQAQKKQSNAALGNVSAMLADSWRLMKVPSFIRTILLVGIPTKMALTGIISFAVPLLLAQRGVSKESIGQVLMAYAAIVLLVSYKVGPWVDKYNGSKIALSLGNLVAGCALLLLAIAIVMPETWQVITVMTLAMMLLGLSHGLINAPVVTHVVLNLNDRKESDSVIASTYRFIERLGHIFGSIAVAQMLMWFEAQTAMLVLAGFFVGAFTLFAAFEHLNCKVVSS